jgi:hypothetical protein
MASVCGDSFGGSRIGSSADMPRSGGKVTIPSVPSRTRGAQHERAAVQVDQVLDDRQARAAPCSADLIAFGPWPHESSTIGMSSGMPGPVSRTL